MTMDGNSGAVQEVELLSFRLNDQEYSVDIMSVREIRGWTRATPLPHSPEHVRGVINLRGTVLPVVDLSIRLGMTPLEDDERKVIIVVQIGEQSIGLLVDAVSDILAMPVSELQPPPSVTGEDISGFIEALTIVEGRMIRVLNLSTVLPQDNMDAA